MLPASPANFLNINHTPPQIRSRSGRAACRSGRRSVVEPARAKHPAATLRAARQHTGAAAHTRTTSRRRAAAEPGRARASADGRPQAGYTIAHAGRQVRFGPVAFWIAVGTVVIMAGWSITTATYFAFHDDVSKR